MNYYKNIIKGSGNDRCEKHPAWGQAMSRLPGRSFCLNHPERLFLWFKQGGKKTLKSKYNEKGVMLYGENL
jgi:hypothetical protein